MSKVQSYSNTTLTLLCLCVLFQPILVHAKCTCEAEYEDLNKGEALNFKLVAIASILVASALGVCIPLVLNHVPALQPESGPHFIIKAFAAGVILATGFIHILPDAFDSLSSPCLKSPWEGFPFAGFIAMMAAIGTLMMEAFATGYHKRAELRKAQPVNGDDEESGAHAGHVHGHSAIILQRSDSSDLIRNRVISQVLELGIVVHSVVIGISMGATQSPKTIKPLIAALSFHQFFEGMGLGGCISQAKYKSRAITIMVLFFSLTTPTGITIGIGISNIYNEYSPTALIVEGVLNSASAGILIYMALVDLLASDFMNPKLQTNFRLQLGSNLALLVGASSMAILAKWGGA
ncbi:zinc transporter 8-like [Actinidia eriantha]|uniref:zinc transporter 8-like n=1 Tax=Actinidia eriantha TaxID=165200 RepID=UPI002588B213|nr:zinc transporter 8-like [Actinidia eriantha]